MDSVTRERDQHMDVGDERNELLGSLQQGIARPENGIETAKCAFQSCKSKPMPLCMFCYNHILSDERQQLYKACSYVVKSCAARADLLAACDMWDLDTLQKKFPL